MDVDQQINVIPAEMIGERFDRIEKKIDKLSDAMISLARTEEKIMSMEVERSNVIERLNRHSEKIDSINDKVNDNTRVISNITKVTWIVSGSLIAGFLKMMGFM